MNRYKLPVKRVLGKGLASRWRQSLALLGLLAPALGLAQLAGVGDLAEDFEVRNIRTNDPINLYDYEGSIVVLDFFFYW